MCGIHSEPRRKGDNSVFTPSFIINPTLVIVVVFFKLKLQSAGALSLCLWLKTRKISTLVSYIRSLKKTTVLD